MSHGPLDQSRFKLQWIQVDKLRVVWPDAQRPFKDWWAKEIAENFDPDQFTPVRVMLPNGHGIYHICDGQHEVRAAAMALGLDQQVPCIVAQESDPVKAAALFDNINSNRQRVSNIEAFKVRVTRRNQTEVAIDRIVRHCGFHVDASKAANAISAVSALNVVYTQYGAKVLDQTLTVIRVIWPDDTTATTGNILRGIGMLLVEHAHADIARLQSCMTGVSTATLVREAKTEREMQHVSVAAAIGHIIVSRYNKGLKPNQQLKRKGKGSK
jgi:hypothetical protein